jgi:hypothetical protein
MTDTPSATDGVFSYLARNLIALVVDPLGPYPAELTRLCGLARVGDQRARVVLSVGARTTPGIAIEFNLTQEDASLDVPAAVDFTRRVAAAGMDRIANSGRASDSHGNIVVTATELGFSEPSHEATQDLAMFSLFSVLVHGGGFPWFEDVFTFNGFMSMPNDSFRLYLKRSETKASFGVQIPLRAATGVPVNTFSALHQELVALIREGELFRREPLDEDDDYCDSVFDLSGWLGVSH